MNDGKNFPTKVENRSPVLHDNGLRAGSLIEVALSRLDEQQAKNLMAKAAEEALRLEVKNREQNMDYIAGKKVAEDHIDAFNMLPKGDVLTRQVMRSTIKTGAGEMKIESKSGATCFVASVTYGDPNHPDVLFLRWYRDTVLSKSKCGLAFIAWYWRFGPKLAKIVGRSQWLKNISRRLISMIVILLK